VRNTARALLEGVQALRSGKLVEPGSELEAPRKK
jgi:hypothetical protein